jgi:hypothetical protein
MKTYRAAQHSTSVLIHEDGEPQRELKPRYDLARYSTGFAWGRPCPGALQLSLALLCDALDDEAVTWCKARSCAGSRVYITQNYCVIPTQKAVQIHAGPVHHEGLNAQP